MDKTTETRHRHSLRYEDLTPVAVHTAKLLIDAVACAIGGYHSAPGSIARRLAAQASGKPAARVIGSGMPTSMEAATFANSVMLRVISTSTTLTLRSEKAHPSDAIPCSARGCRRISARRQADASRDGRRI
ncbi:MAG: MmgE/PrpD family protein [Burkholderiales bacterium]|nr:MmgE/PrpD family protein [Burkholderiales bacterium]